MQQEIKKMIIEVLNLEDITADEIDADEDVKKHFESLASLAKFVEENKS